MRTLVLTAAIAFSTLPAAAQTATPPAPAKPPAQPSSPAAQNAALAQRLQQHITKETLGTWWGGILVMRDGQTLIKYTHGLAHEDGTPFDEHTLFEIGEVSSAITAVAMLKLEQQGKLSIDDPVSRFYPTAPEQIAKAPLRSIINHTAGISEKTPIAQTDPNDRDACALAVLASPLDKPGTWSYARRNGTVLAAIIEKASGQPFDDYLRKEVFAPAGMKETGFVDLKGLEKLHSAVRVSTGRVIPPGRFGIKRDWNWTVRGGSGVVTTLHDIELWEKALRSDTVLSRDQVEKFNTMTAPTFALGEYLTTTNRHTRKVWIGGASPGHIAISFRYVDEDTAIFTFSNETGDADLMAFGLEDVLFPQLPQFTRGELIFPEGTASNAPLTEDGHEFGARRVADGIELQVSAGKPRRVAASVVMSEGTTRSILALMADAVRFPVIDEGVSGTTVTLDARYLGIDGQNKATFGDQAHAEFRTVLEGSDKGQATFERRPVFAVIDPKARGWPLVVRMDRESAQRLYKSLTDAVASPRPETKPAVR